jgi:hypothetical protein
MKVFQTKLYIKQSEKDFGLEKRENSMEAEDLWSFKVT